MPRLDHTTFVNSRRDERSLGHHTLRAYAQDLRTFARFAEAHHFSDPLSKDDILAYHRHLRDELDSKPTTIERRLVSLKSYYAWREDRNSALPSPFADVRISVRIPRRLPRPIERDTLKTVLHAGERAISAQSARGTDKAAPASQSAITLLIIKLLIVTGLRISELTNLKVRDVSPDGSQILVNGKGSKERIFFVPNRELQEEFQRHCQMRSEHGSIASPLFLNTVGRRLRAATFHKRLRALSKRLGIEPLDPALVPALCRGAPDREEHRHPHGSGTPRARQSQNH
ncbi:MAG: tyrosine-type recombinase/integrase [Pseudomonadota bacterium]